MATVWISLAAVVPTQADDDDEKEPPSESCPSATAEYLDACGGSTGNGVVDLWANDTTPGTGGGTGGRGGGGRDAAPVPCTEVLPGKCMGFGRRPVDVDPATPPVSISDVAHFAPTPALDSMEPNGWAVVGLDTNFYATGGVHVRDGVLLGMPASVRFTPVAWHWDYGDGAARSSSTPGGSWAQLRVAEFDPTPTSHVYTAKGTYVIRLLVDFAADYRLDGGTWVPVMGVLRIPTNELVATAGSVKTVLVEHDCLADPGGPGC